MNSTKRTRTLQQVVFWATVAILTALLVLRDVCGMGINKYLFVILLAPGILLLQEKYALMLWGMMLPLYVGLPGNVLTLLMFIRFLMKRIHHGKLKIEAVPFALTIVLAVYIAAQNLFLGFSGMYYMIFSLEWIVMYFFMTTDMDDYLPQVVISYSIGVMLVGVVMLAYTLQHTDFSKLLSVASRLGYLGRTDRMTIIVDPNYYGLFTITSLSVNWCMSVAGRYTKRQSVIGIGVSIISAGISIIGMSRAFILCLALWAVLVVVTEKRISVKVGFSLLAIVVAFGAFYYLSDSVTAVLERFQGSDMATGNGRTTLALEHIEYWLENAGTILFGIGLFNSRVHCMPLQMLTGLGLIGFFLVAALFICYYYRERKLVPRLQLTHILPIIVVQGMSATVPTAQSMTFLAPVFISILVFGAVCRK